MTQTVVVKCPEGIVLAGESATVSAIAQENPDGRQITREKVYGSTDKVFSLGDLPVGIMASGTSGVHTAGGLLRVDAVIADFRHELNVDSDRYTVEQIARSLSDYLDRSGFRFQARERGHTENTDVVVAGYSAAARHAETWLVTVQPGDGEIACRQVQGPQSRGLLAFGEKDTIHRLMGGYSMALPTVLNRCSLSDGQRREVMQNLGRLSAPLGIENMPLRDAIDLAQLLVEVTIRFTAFLPGQDTVLGPIDIAAITRHEGFRWERRKPKFGSN